VLNSRIESDNPAQTADADSVSSDAS